MRKQGSKNQKRNSYEKKRNLKGNDHERRIEKNSYSRRSVKTKEIGNDHERRKEKTHIPGDRSKLKNQIAEEVEIRRWTKSQE